MLIRFSRTRAMLALVGVIGVFTSGFAITANVVSAAPAAIFSENFNSITLPYQLRRRRVNRQQV